MGGGTIAAMRMFGKATPEWRPRDTGVVARAPATLPARALALQRSIGNRGATRVLARWAKHPDEEKKGVMVPDVVAEDFAHFNPPKNE